jgi:hypothetical protein
MQAPIPLSDDRVQGLSALARQLASRRGASRWLAAGPALAPVGAGFQLRLLDPLAQGVAR